MEQIILKFFEEIKSLHGSLEQLREKQQQPDPYFSKDTKDIAAALSKAQGEYHAINYNRENPYFKSAYADLDTILKAVRPALAKNGLSFIQQTRITDDGATMLHSILMHSSGQWIESRNRILPPKNDPQSYGSTLSYLKRYAAMSLLGVAVSHDISDDDAEVAMVDSRDIIAKGTALNTKYNPKEQSLDVITKEQLDELNYELAEYPDIAEMVLDGLRIQSLADMPKTKYMASITRIRDIKNLRNGNKK